MCYEARACVCVLLLQDLLQSCARGGRRRVEDMCYERRRAEACVDESAQHAPRHIGGEEENIISTSLPRQYQKIKKIFQNGGMSRPPMGQQA
jgi:hypothetical protein